MPPESTAAVPNPRHKPFGERRNVFLRRAEELTMTSYQESLNATTSAQRLGGRKVGPNDWRIPHLCGGSAAGAPLEDNPGLSIGDGDSGLLVACHYGCNAAEAYKAVFAALGIDQTTRRPRRAGGPEFETGRCPCPNCGTEALLVARQFPARDGHALRVIAKLPTIDCYPPWGRNAGRPGRNTGLRMVAPGGRLGPSRPDPARLKAPGSRNRWGRVVNDHAGAHGD